MTSMRGLHACTGEDLPPVRHHAAFKWNAITSFLLAIDKRCKMKRGPICRLLMPGAELPLSPSCRSSMCRQAAPFRGRLRKAEKHLDALRT